MLRRPRSCVRLTGLLPPETPGQTRPCRRNHERTALQHRPRIPSLDQDAQCPVCGQVLDRFCDHVVVCPCGRDRNRRHTAVAHASVHRRRRPVCSKPVRTLTAFHSGPALVDLPTFGFLHVQDMPPEAWDIAVTFCLRPQTRSPGPTTSTQNLADCKTLKRTFHDTANRCHQLGNRFTSVVFDGDARGWGDSARSLVTWISQRLSTTSHRTPSDINLELALITPP